jgi:hypothetical protein
MTNRQAYLEKTAAGLAKLLRMRSKGVLNDVQKQQLGYKMQNAGQRLVHNHGYFGGVANDSVAQGFQQFAPQKLNDLPGRLDDIARRSQVLLPDAYLMSKNTGRYLDWENKIRRHKLIKMLFPAKMSAHKVPAEASSQALLNDLKWFGEAARDVNKGTQQYPIMNVAKQVRGDIKAMNPQMRMKGRFNPQVQTPVFRVNELEGNTTGYVDPIMQKLHLSRRPDSAAYAQHTGQHETGHLLDTFMRSNMEQQLNQYPALNSLSKSLADKRAKYWKIQQKKIRESDRLLELIRRKRQQYARNDSYADNNAELYADLYGLAKVQDSVPASAINKEIIPKINKYGGSLTNTTLPQGYRVGGSGTVSQRVENAMESLGRGRAQEFPNAARNLSPDKQVLYPNLADLYRG